MRIYVEYGCPKGKWGCSSPAKTEKGFWYRGQITLSVKTPPMDCVKEGFVLKVCEDCPVKGMVESHSLTLWDSEESWEPIGGYKSAEVYRRSGAGGF